MEVGSDVTPPRRTVQLLLAMPSERLCDDIHASGRRQVLVDGSKDCYREPNR